MSVVRKLRLPLLPRRLRGCGGSRLARLPDSLKPVVEIRLAFYVLRALGEHGLSQVPSKAVKFLMHLVLLAAGGVEIRLVPGPLRDEHNDPARPPPPRAAPALNQPDLGGDWLVEDDQVRGGDVEAFLP